MSLERISRWVWAAVGAAVGLGIGLLRLAGSAGDFARYGECLASQKRFEAALVSEAGGRKALDGLVVLPERVQSFDGTSRPVHVVAGDLERAPGGRQDSANGHRQRVFYVAGVPYSPVSATATLTGGASVRSYLDSLKPQRVTYRYAWWREPRWSVSLWTVGGAGYCWRGVAVSHFALGLWHRATAEGAAGHRPAQRPTIAAARGPRRLRQGWT